MKTNICIVALLCLSLLSCKNEKASIKVQNNISNVKLTNIGYHQTTLASSLLPGETSSEREFIDYHDSNDDDFPVTSYIEFNMSAKGNTIYLRTEQTYILDKDVHLHVILSDSTKVINPYSSVSAQGKAMLRDFK